MYARNYLDYTNSYLEEQKQWKTCREVSSTEGEKR
jgi:hypothetical protein